VAGWAATPCPKTAALDTIASATTPENLETPRIVGSSCSPRETIGIIMARTRIVVTLLWCCAASRAGMQ
jgi:hypothetical protein